MAGSGSRGPADPGGGPTWPGGFVALPDGPTPELILEGRIATLRGDSGYGWAEAIAIAGGRVLAAGDARHVRELAGPATRRIRLADDEAVVPGLTDAHLHLGLAALSAERVDLRSASTLEAGLEVVRRWADAHPDAARWIEGSGWDAARWGVWPTAADLESVAPGRLVALWSHDHHALLLSRRAIDALSIERSTEDPTGGIVRRDEHGLPTGVLQERAVGLVADRLSGDPAGRAGTADPSDPSDRLGEAIARYAARLVASGIVAVHDPGPLLPDPSLRADMEACCRLDAQGRLPLRVHVSVREESIATARERGIRGGMALAPGPVPAAPSAATRSRGATADATDAGADATRRYGSRCHAGWLKLFADGALGSRTAALLDPYEPVPGEEPGWLGVTTLSHERLAELVGLAASAGIPAEVHAIGDAAVRLALDVLARAATTWPGPMRHRIEHIQLLAAGDAARFGEFAIGASVQPIHLRSDAEPARRAWGTRADERGYPYRTLADAGAVLAFGSDAPVEDADPWAGLAYAVLRRAPGAPVDVFGAGETLGLAAALRAACLAPAQLAGEADRGRLLPGQRADLVIVPARPFVEPDGVDGIASVRPRAVLIDGAVASGGLS